MNLKSMLKPLLVAGITLFITHCGGDLKTDAPSETQIPDTLPNSLKIKRSSKTYVITGIGVSGSNSIAIINNQLLSPGMEIGPGVTLKNVRPTYATIVYGNTTHLLRPENIQAEMNKKKP